MVRKVERRNGRFLWFHIVVLTKNCQYSIIATDLIYDFGDNLKLLSQATPQERATTIVEALSNRIPAKPHVNLRSLSVF